MWRYELCEEVKTEQLHKVIQSRLVTVSVIPSSTHCIVSILVDRVCWAMMFIFDDRGCKRRDGDFSTTVHFHLPWALHTARGAPLVDEEGSGANPHRITRRLCWSGYGIVSRSGMQRGRWRGGGYFYVRLFTICFYSYLVEIDDVVIVVVVARADETKVESLVNKEEGH